MLRAVSISLACLLGAQVAHAQPARGKGDAVSLLQSGLKLFAAKDYLGALAVFRDAYERFPSSKILLNIGTTLVKLDRKAEAANTYQRYLDADDADPAKRREVTRVLGELDRDVGLIEVTVEPADDAELQLGQEDWAPAGALTRHRVQRREFTIRARRAGHVPAEETVTVGPGETQRVALTLVPEPVAQAQAPEGVAVEGGVQGRLTPRPRARLGALAIAHIDPINAGGAALLGVTYDLRPQVQLQLAALLGPSLGGYAGASYALLPGRVRPLVSAGVPVFVSSGARFALRGAGGVELAVSRHLSIIAELGVEYLVNPEPGVGATLFIPALGATGRL